MLLGCRDLEPKISGGWNEWVVERRVTVEGLRRAGLRGKLREMQHARRVKGSKNSSSVIGVPEVAGDPGTAQSEKAAFKQSRIQMLNDVGKMCNKFDNATLTV